MLRQFTVGGIAALVAIVVATMAAAVSPTEAKCTRTCQWKCDGVGALGRCVGKWYKQCGEWRCSRTTG
jgi:hypothetical protein